MNSLLRPGNRRGSIARQLAKRFGGTWTYDYHASWWCDDGIRRVSRVHTGGFDVNGEALPGHGYYLHHKGRPSKRIYL